jgi:hypothetical protein
MCILVILLIVTNPDAGPWRVMSLAMLGSGTVILIVAPARALISIMSEPLLLPAAHSPALNPDGELLFAAMMASRKVHIPSIESATSDRLLTTMVDAAFC